MSNRELPTPRRSILNGDRIIEILVLVAILTALFHAQIGELLGLR